jgi:uncharacterized membrane protein YraQ (UPF0718 family)
LTDAAWFALRLAAELTVLFLAVSTAVRLLQAWLDRRGWRDRLAALPLPLAIPAAALLGGVTPFCSCSGVPVAAGLARAGLPPGAVASFLVASPLVSPVALVLLWSTGGPAFAVAFLGGALAVAVAGGVFVSLTWRSPLAPRTARSSPAELALLPHPVSGLGAVAAIRPPAEFVRAVRGALDDLRRLAPWLAVAVLAGAALHGFVPAGALAGLAGQNSWLAVPAAALLGLPVYASVAILAQLAGGLL